ncbi:MAG TPA: hypothetical protein VNP73_03790, partial [Actinomycetota bacterium]|nr:hypothetical protein [Actinomycetota bacterium]
MRKLFLVSMLAAFVTLIPSGFAHAHPLGNFSVNRFSGLEIGDEEVTVHYVIDMAEVPTLQLLPVIDLDKDGGVDERELTRFVTSLGPKLGPLLKLQADGRSLPLEVQRAEGRFSRGQGSLDVLRIEIDYSADLTSSSARIDYADGTFPGRRGWVEVVAYTSGDQGIEDSSVPTTSVSSELRRYPKDMLKSPVAVQTAIVDVDPGAAAAPRPSDAAPQAREVSRLEKAFTGLIERRMSPGVFVLAILIALAFGAVHALGPGHGKAIMAAYLVGTKGRVRHAVTVGIAVSLMHTLSVIGLGAITLWASSMFPPEAVYPYLSLASAAVVLGLGGYLLTKRLRSRHVHSHEHPHDHSHDHSHHHGHETVDVMSWKGLTAIALSGGLLPSPSALIVLLGAVALHRVALGITLVGAFSIGLAGALAVIGILVLQARSVGVRFLGERTASAIPLISAALIF